METVHLYIINHKGKDRIAVDSPLLTRLNNAIQHIPGIKWSRTKKKWHLPCTQEAVSDLIQKTKGIVEINIDQLREQLKQRKNFRQNQNSATDESIPLLPGSIIVQPPKASSLVNPKNILALQQYMQLLAIKAYSQKTIRTYHNEFLQFLKKLDHIAASSLNAMHVKRYMEYCAVTERLSENTLHSRLNAIKFYYENVLGQDKMLWEIPRAKKPLLLPKVLSENELKRMFFAAKNLKHKAILFTAYSAGLRVSEVVKLRLRDIDSERMQIFVARAKGKKDRVVNLSVLLLDILRQYIKLQKPRPTDYLFPSDDIGKPYSERSAQVIFQRAKDAAGITKQVSFHSLRHSFATHLLEKGIDVKYIKDLLGHFDIRTTERYLHVRKDKLINIMSPLDSLYEDDPEGLLRIDATNNLKNQQPLA